MKKKILWLGLSFLLVAALVLASCGPAEDEEEVTTEEEEEIVAEEDEEEVVAEEDEEEVTTEEEEETPQSVNGSDSRLRIVVDNIERYNRDLDPEWEGHFGVRPLRPDEGVDLIVVYLTIAPIQDICAGYVQDPMEAFLEESVLADTDGNECRVCLITYDQVMPHLGSSCRDEYFLQEATVEIDFPFPEYATPAKLKLIYSFLEPGEGKSIQRGEIDIILP